MGLLDRLSKQAVVLIGVIAAFATLDAIESIAAPMALALVVGVVLSPLTDFWERRGYSPVFGALIGLVVALLLLAELVLVFQPVAARMIDQAPKVWSDMQEAIRVLQGLVRGLSDMTDEVRNTIAADANAGSDAPAPEPVELPTVGDALMAAPVILSQALIFSGVLFFFLLTRRDIYHWVALHLSADAAHAAMVAKLRKAERLVSRYFLTITLINAAVGAATAVFLRILGMPDAILWGVVAFLLNFILYLGPTVFVVALLFAGVAAFDGGLVLVPAAGFVLLNTIEGQFVTPALVGRHMRLNPLLVFLALIFGIWLWGPIGGIVAMPLLLWALVLSGALSGPAEV